LHESFYIEPDSSKDSDNLPSITKLRGKSSFYSNKFSGKSTASGQPYDPTAFTGAHRTLPFGTRVKVTNLNNNKSVIIIINDRGPHKKDRIIDISRIAAEELDMIRAGIIEVEIEILKKESDN
jgi:rare lipoprotein A